MNTNYNDELKKLVQRAEDWGAKSVGFDEMSFFHEESQWRAESPVFDTWLKNFNNFSYSKIANEIGQSCGRSELIDLSGALSFLKDNDEALLKQLHGLLTDIREKSSKEYTITQRVEDTGKLKNILEEIEKVANSKVTHNLSRKWPILTSLLANAAPNHFIFIRPSVVTSEFLSETIFQGVEYKSGTSPSLYKKYLECAEKLQTAMKQHPKIGDTPKGLRSVSEWWTSFAYKGYDNK